MERKYPQPGWSYYLLVLLSLLSAASLSAQVFLDPIDTTAMMRDGKELGVDIYLPDGPGPWPVVLIKTPYNRTLYRFNNLPLGINGDIATADYAIVTADWRCFYGSASACILDPNRGEDGYDLVEWIAAQPWSDGKIGMHSASALGNIQFMTAREKPPHLTCISPQVFNPVQNYAHYFEGGIAKEEFVATGDVLGFGFSTFVYANPFENLLWSIAAASTFYPDEIEIPVLATAGWYDHNIKANLEMFEGLRDLSPAAVKDQHRMLIGPWVHGELLSAEQGELSYPTAENWSDSIALRFFDFYLRTLPNDWLSRPAISWYKTGADFWEDSDEWPPPAFEPQEWFFHPDQSLLQITEGSATELSYLYDPMDPSPTIGGRTLSPLLEQGPYDQATLVESRSDNLIFSTPLLSSSLEMSGTPVVKLFVSSDRPDTDFMVRLTDVFPDGRSMLISESARRLRFRNGFTTADTASATSGQVYELSIELPPLSYHFKAGHRLRIVVSSSNWPRYNRNKNDGGEMYVSGDSLIAQNSVHLGGIYPSSISFLGPDYISKILEVEQSNSVLIYPNPAHTSLRLEWTAAPKTVELALFDLQGKLVRKLYSGWLDQQQQLLLNLGDLPKGNYFLLDLNGGPINCGSLSIQ